MLGLPQIALIAGRRANLHHTWAGLQRTGHYLVLYDGGSFGPAVPEDDSGLFLFAPAIARVFHGSIDTAATILLAGSLILALGLGLYAWCRFARTWQGKLLGAAAYAVFGALALWIGDTYSVATTLTLGLVPWLLLATRERSGPLRWALLLTVTGVAIGVGQLIRTSAGVQVLAVAAALVLTLEARWSRRVLLLGCLAVALVVPGVAFRAALARRDAYLAGVVAHYQPPTGTHPFWHSIYIGQGFLTNDRGLYYNDEVASDRVRLIDPGARYISPRYEAVVRRMVFDLVRADPMLVIQNEAAKAGLLAFYFLVFANLGIVAALARPKPWRQDVALGVGLAVAALPGMLVIPDFRYIFGFTTLSALFGLASLDRALARGWPFAGRGAAARPMPADGAAARAPAAMAR